MTNLTSLLEKKDPLSYEEALDLGKAISNKVPGQLRPVELAQLLELSSRNSGVRLSELQNRFQMTRQGVYYVLCKWTEVQLLSKIGPLYYLNRDTVLRALTNREILRAGAKTNSFRLPVRSREVIRTEDAENSKLLGLLSFLLLEARGQLPTNSFGYTSVLEFALSNEAVKERIKEWGKNNSEDVWFYFLVMCVLTDNVEYLAETFARAEIEETPNALFFEEAARIFLKEF